MSFLHEGASQGIPATKLPAAGYLTNVPSLVRNQAVVVTKPFWKVVWKVAKLVETEELAILSSFWPMF